MKANNDIRQAAKENHVYLYEIASFLNISEPTIIRRLRLELSEEKKVEMRKIIDYISRQKKNAIQSASNTLNG